MAVTACGKKGPPLAPVIRVPAAVQAIAAARVGDEVFLTVTVPSKNIDASTPAAVRRVDVYAYTGLEAPGPRMMASATLVASIPVAEVPLDASGEPLPPTPQAGEVLQGAVVTMRDVLTAEARTPRSLPPLIDRRGPSPLPPGATPPVPPVAQRFYTAFGVSGRGRSGPGGSIAAVPLGPIPDPPSSLLAEYTPLGIRLAWEPAGGLVGFLLDRDLGPDVAPIDESPVTVMPGSATALPDLPAGPTRYNVYREIAPDPLELPPVPARGAWQADPPVAVNQEPLGTLTFEDPVLLDGRERCYHVRAVRGTRTSAAQSVATPRVCVTAVDSEPPTAPAGLTAEADGGAMTLLWDPNVEEDLAGYLILRGVAGGATLNPLDATLNPLTERPVPNARYVDRAVTPGIRYVYAVVAVDDRVPLGNVSGESNRVEVTAQ